MGKVKDLTGKVFGRLTVIEFVGVTNNKAKWNCICDCGNSTIANGIDLRNGKKLSCGCLHSEILINRNKNMRNKNTYVLSGEYGIGYDSKGNVFYFDLEDFSKIKDDYWMINKDGYVVTSNNKKFMHRIIMEVEDESWREIQIDHKHGKNTRNDNRKENLRIASPSTNGMNKDKYKNNSSGVTGVYWNKKLNKWVVYISINKKSKYLGSFINKEDAIKVRKEAEEKYYKEYRFKK